MLQDDIEAIDNSMCTCQECEHYRVAWDRIKTALAEFGTTPNNARDEICSRCDNDEALARIFGGGQFSFCPKCGRKLSPVA